MKSIKFVAFFILALALILVSCTPKATEAPVEEEAAPVEEEAAPVEEEAAPVEEEVVEEEPMAESHTLVIAMNTGDLMTLDPAWAGEATNMFIHANVYQQLVNFDPADINTPLPSLAESWEAEEGATDFTFHLRPDVLFSSGNPFTAKDVAFSWMRGKNMQNWFFDPIDSFEIIDDLTIKVHLAFPSADFMAIVSIPGFGITDSELVKEHGGTDAEGAFETDTAKEWLDQNSAGTAPYVMTSWAPKAEVVFELNPNYWGDTPYYDRVIIKHVEDPTTMLQMLQKGDVDIVPSLNIDLVEMAQADDSLNVVVSNTFDINYLAMTSNCATATGPETAALLCQKEVRQAVVAGIDYDGLIDAVLMGYGTRAPSIIPVGMMGVDPSKVEGRDVEKAKALLEAAGYGDGITLDLFYAVTPERDVISAKIKNDLAEVGITVNLNPLEETVYLDQMRAQELPFCFGGWVPDYLDVTLWTDYYSSIENGIAFRMWFDNARAAELKGLIKGEVVQETREAYVEELQDIWMEEAPFTMLYQKQTIAAMNSDLKGYAYHPAHWLHVWDLTK
ncbi:MAG: ABC transporter substrate-binding protein [Anaerolineaceae bacterium]|nr:ABC transporter substrate-binding protein [Anaerolineaceae bacterium]